MLIVQFFFVRRGGEVGKSSSSRPVVVFKCPLTVKAEKKEADRLLAGRGKEKQTGAYPKIKRVETRFDQGK